MQNPQDYLGILAIVDRKNCLNEFRMLPKHLIALFVLRLE